MRKRKRLWALVLSAALIVTQIPAVAMAENYASEENYVPEDKANFTAGEREDALGHGTIAAFAKLPGSVTKQNVTLGTELSGLNLPDMLTATVYHVTEDTILPDEDNTEDESGDPSTTTPSDADESVSGNRSGDSTAKGSGKTVTAVTTSSQDIPVTWDSTPAYDGGTEGRYVFTPDVGGYTLSSGAKLPRITVSVSADTAENPPENPTENPAENSTENPPAELAPCTKTEGCTLSDGHEGECVTAPPANGPLIKTITGWMFVDSENLNGGELTLTGVSMDNQADLDTVVSMLPTQIIGQTEGEAEPTALDITWSCPDYERDDSGNWPLTGECTFTAILPEGYACAPLPSVKVTLGGSGVLTINDRHYVGDLAYQEIGPKTVQLIGPIDIAYTGTLYVPDEITSRGRTYSVTDIGNRAFESVRITGLDLSGADNLTRIGQNAFNQCTNLTGTIRIPAGVTDIDVSAFENSGITGLDLSGATSLTRIGSRAWNQCVDLTGTISIPAEVREIGDWSFYSSGITGLDLSGANGLTRIGKNTFYDCTGLTGTVSVPATVMEIGMDAFLHSSISGFTAADEDVAALLRDCGVKESIITLPDGNSPSIPPVDEFDFLDLKYRVTGTDTVSVVGFKSDLSGDLKIPDQALDGDDSYRVTEIEHYAFENSGITSLDLSGAHFLTRIGSSAFANLSHLTGTVKIPASVTEIDDGAFLGTGITSLDLSGAVSLAQIGAETFYGCDSLTGTVKIPASVTEIGGSAFHSTGITGLDLREAASLTQIGAEAFCICDSLTGTVAIPSHVTENGGFAFQRTAITGLDFSGAASLTVIGRNAFQNCGSLTGTVDIPAAVTKIGERAFEFTNITEAVIRGRLQSMGTRAFPFKTTIHCSDPHTQLLVNEVLMQTEIPTASWDGQSDIPPGAVVTVDSDITVNGTVNIGEDVEIIIKDGMTVTVENGSIVNMEPGAVITVKPGGTLTIDPGASLTGGGTIKVEPGGALIGTPGSGITVISLVTVVGGTGGGMFAAGSQVSISADPAPAGKVFDMWTSQDGVSFDNADSASTTFTMPAKAVTVTAAYKAPPVTTYTVVFDPAGGTRTGGGELIQIVSAGASATAPTVTRSGYTFTGWDKDFSRITADLTVTAQWNKNSTTGGGSSTGESSYSEPEPQSSYTVAGDDISQSVTHSDLKKLADSGKSLALRCDKASITFGPGALKAILEAVPSAAGSITFAAAPADLGAFPDAAKQIGAHLVYDFTISCKDGGGNPVTVPVNFPAGSAAITLNYAPMASEVTGSLFMVYVDGEGAVTWLDQSSYDAGKVLAEVSHFSTYGVACKAPAPVFTDIAGHWAKEDIEFAAARGLLSGTGNNQFSPDGAMTREMFVTALGRLAGINPDSYQSRSFTDVKADAYYAAYVEWAAQKGIVSGTGEGLFSPDAPVTREQMAVMLMNYAGQMGCSIPTPLAAVTFTDNDKISAWAAKEVAAMQRAGIIRGKDGNRFDPQENATRAEASAVLRRFVEIVIDPATATGWVKNDSGHWLYYKDGIALTGWQTIGRLHYYFNTDGVMHEGWKQDESTGKWYYWTSAGAAAGWREIGGKWYYFDEDGSMAVNTTIDGYEIGPDGARKEE